MAPHSSLKRKLIISTIVALFSLIVAIIIAPKKAPLHYEGKISCPQEALVTKVIDGDTIVIEGGEHVRLLGIDTDEKNYPCYESAKKRLEELILNKKVKLEKSGKESDQYGRCLRYVFYKGKNIDLELIKEGLAVARFYLPNQKYEKEIQEAEKEAIEKKIGCKWEGKKKERATKEKKLTWSQLTPQKTGLKLVNACQTNNLEGEFIIEGKVVGSYYSSKGIVFLNLERKYPNQCFTAVIFSSDLNKFPKSPEKYYQGKTVRVKGKIKDYKGRKEIVLENPTQIEIGK